MYWCGVSSRCTRGARAEATAGPGQVIVRDSRGVPSVYARRGHDKAGARGQRRTGQAGVHPGKEGPASKASSREEASLWCVHCRAVSTETTWAQQTQVQSHCKRLHRTQEACSSRLGK